MVGSQSGGKGPNSWFRDPSAPPSLACRIRARTAAAATTAAMVVGCLLSPPRGASTARDSPDALLLPDLASPSCFTSSLVERTSQSRSLTLTPPLSSSFGDRRLVRSERALALLPPQQMLLAEVGKTPLTWVLLFSAQWRRPLIGNPDWPRV